MLTKPRGQLRLRPLPHELRQQRHKRPRLSREKEQRQAEIKVLEAHLQKKRSQQDGDVEEAEEREKGRHDPLQNQQVPQRGCHRRERRRRTKPYFTSYRPVVQPRLAGTRAERAADYFARKFRIRPPEMKFYFRTLCTTVTHPGKLGRARSQPSGVSVPA